VATNAWRVPLAAGRSGYAQEPFEASRQRLGGKLDRVQLTGARPANARLAGGALAGGSGRIWWTRQEVAKALGLSNLGPGALD